MESKIKISVIIPVYNTDRFLEECVESILDQSFKELEIILVDDGSTDNSSPIIQSYADKHTNIVALRQENQGQGVARNLGLSEAKGDFIAFVDSDDRIPFRAYEEMYRIAVQHNSDMVVGIQQSFNEKRTWCNVPVHRKYFKKLLINTDVEQSPYLLEDISCCNRLIRHDLIKQYALQFPAASREDLDFTAKLYLYSSKISIFPHVAYSYRGRIGSDTGTIQLAYFQDWVDIVENLKTIFENSNKETLFPVLLRSEMKKLVVQSRFLKIIRNTEYPERIKIFNLLNLLSNQLSKKDISESGAFSLREQVRVFMLQQQEYDCLEMFEKKPWRLDYLAFLQKSESYQKISEPLLRLYMQEINLLNKGKRLNIKIRFPKLFKSYERISYPYRRWQQACLRRRKADIPLSALSNYFLLYPVVKVINLFSDGNQVWLIDERLSKSAEDNGFFLFQYLRNHYPKLKVYYVIKSDSPDRARVEKLGQVIRQYSLAHAYSLLQARVILSTDSLRSLAFPAEIFRRLWGRTHNVFLQHGVMAVKKTVYSRKNYFYFSQVITSSNREKKVFVEDYNFPEESIAITGLARFDNFWDPQQNDSTRKILVVPTWRLGLQSLQQIKASKYYWAWSELLADPMLTQLLERYQVSLVFRPHQNILPFISDFAVDTEYIHIQKENVPPLFQLIKESSLLITDYSSIMFDFFYQDKPVISYMFDRKEMEQTQGGTPHIDIDRELPADLHDTSTGVLSSLERYLANNFSVPAVQRSKVVNFIKYRDNKNCERIYQSIRQRIT